ncbi:MAG: hypothetical protein R2731_07705 [Nocardioides sp.]
MNERRPHGEHRAAARDSRNRPGGLATMLGIVWRTRRRGILVWSLVLAGSMAFTALAVAGLYDTQAKIQSYADAVTSGNALKAINGHVEGIDTLGGVIQDEFGFMASFLMPLLGISLVAGSTRRDEEAGRLEALLAGRVARQHPVLAALVVATAAIVGTALLFAVGLLVSGVPLSGSVLYAASLGALALVFAALAGVLAQVTRHARGVYTGSLIVLAVAYVLRGVGDVTETWWTWLSPLGWQEKTAPFGPQRWWVLVVPLAVAALLGVAAARLAARRDLGSALLADGAKAAAGSAYAAQPARLRRLRAPARGARLARRRGAADRHARRALAAAAGRDGRQPRARGGDGRAARRGAGRVRRGHPALPRRRRRGVRRPGDRHPARRGGRGRLETRLAGTLSRTGWLLAHGVVLLGGLLVVVLGSSLVLAVATAWSTGSWSELGAILRSGLAYLPAELVLAGLALAAYGWRPRAFPVAWVGYAAMTFVAFLGPGLKFRQWAMDLSPTTHVGNPPVGSVRAVDLLTLGAIGLVLLVVGFVAFRRRGVPQG